MNLTLVWKATLVLGAAAALSVILRRRGSAAQRHMIWTLAFLLLLALPWLPTLWRAQPGPLAIPFAATGTFASGGSPIPWLRWLWLSGAACVLLRLALAHLRLARSPELPIAVTWGILRPRIIAPAGGLHYLDARHEEAHVARRDGLWQLIAQLACALYWFHPLVWWAERRAADERERACDDLVLAGPDAAPPDYAQRLVDAARALSSPPVAALAVSGESGLAGRVEAILDPTVNRRSLRPRDLCCAALLAALLVLTLAPVAAQSQTDGAAAQETKARLIYKVEPEYSGEAREALIEGPVHLTATVLSDGSFSGVEVVSGLGHGLDEKAIEAIRQWRALPATKEGGPVDSSVRITVNFRLD